MTVDVLGAIPVDDLELRSRMLRPGRSVELVEAALSAGGRGVARAQAWRVLHVEDRPAAAACSDYSAATGREHAVRGRRSWVDGYLSAVEWRFSAGAFGQPRTATAWTRLRHPLVPVDPPSPLERVLAVADSGKRASAASWT
jgi:Thioesterase-like superfamily